MGTKYREKKYYCKKYLEVDIYPIFEQLKGSRKKKKTTSDVQKALNDHNRVKKLTRLLNTNFDENDIKIELTYSDDNLPASDEEAEKALKNFLRRLKRFRCKAKLSELKYITITEKGKKTGRYHHHCVLSGGMLLSDVRNIWGKGIIRMTQLELNENGLSGLADYLTKRLTAGEIEENKKAWHASRNLVMPKERQNDSRISKKKARELYENQECREVFEKLYPDYLFSSCRPFYNEVNGQYYLCINMYKKPKPKIHTSGRKRVKHVT